MERPLRVLIVEDSEDDTLLVIRVLKRGGYDPVYERVETEEGMVSALSGGPWDVILCDYKMPRFSGLRALELFKKSGIDIPFILVSGTIGEEIAVEAMKAGAHDYIMKDRLQRLVPAIERELEEVDSRTRRRQAEEALQQSEELLRDTQTISKVGGWEYNPENRRLTWTDEVYRIYGVKRDYDPSDIGKDVSFYSEGDQQTIEQAFLNAVQNGISYDLELRFTAADGTRKWVRTIGRPVRKNGKIVKVFGNIVDITEQKRMVQEISQARDDWETIFQAISHPTIIIDPQHGILNANKAVACASGKSITDLVGMRCYEIFHGKDTVAPPDYCPMERLLSSGRTEAVETEMEALGGVYLVSCKPVLNKRGQVSKVIHIATNITERRKAEESVRDSEEKYRILLEESPDPIFSFTQEGQYKYVNRAFSQGVGKPVQDIIGKTIWDVFPKEEADKRFLVLSEVFRTGKEKTFEVRVPRLDRDQFYLTTVTPVKDATGKVLSAICSSKNITDYKQAEMELRESEERYHAMMEQAADAVFLHDETGQILDVNRKACQTLGYSKEELLSRSIADIDPEAIQAQKNELWGNVLAGEHFTFESRHKRKDGSYIPVEVTMGSLRLPLGVAIVGLVRDITDRKKTEEMLQARMRLMEFANSHNLEVILQKTLDEIGTLTGSPIGFYHFVEADQKTLSLQAWSTRTVQEFCTAPGKGLHYSIDKAGVWVDCVHQRRPVIHNDYESLPHRKGMPEGHASVTRELVVPILRNGLIVAVLGIGNKPSDYDEKDVEIVSYLADVTWEIVLRKRLEMERLESVEKLRKGLGATVQAISMAVEVRDPYTAGHQKRVADLARTIAMEMGLSVDQIEGLRMASVIHDIGKLSIPSEILSKPSKLTQVEYLLLQQHAQAGHEILKDVEFPWPVARIILQHHERLDGSGYPNGLQGDEILLEARILSVADVVEAMATHRPYRPSLGIGPALEEISLNRGALYDPRVVEVCLRLFREREYRLPD